AQGDGPLNGDADVDDSVVKVYNLNDPPPATCGAWTNTGQAADTIRACGALVAFITPEAGQGADLNGDGDRNDRVLQLYDPQTRTVLNVGQAAEEFVCNATLLAFRTSEDAQGHQDLNGDHDRQDDVLQIYDLVARRLINTAQAVVPCHFEACD